MSLCTFKRRLTEGVSVRHLNAGER